MRLSRAVFLDRDGTLNYDAGYTHRIAEWRWLPGALEALRLLHDAGWLLIVASNQSGIGRGYYTLAQLKELEAWLDAQVAAAGAPITAWRYCPHLPDAGCACRKPMPGMILSAAKDLHIDLGASWMLGDKASDVAAGLAAGCQAGLIAQGCNSEAMLVSERFAGAPIWPSLLAAAQAIS